MNEDMNKIITRLVDEQLVAIDRLAIGNKTIKNLDEKIASVYRHLGRIEGLSLAISNIVGGDEDED